MHKIGAMLAALAALVLLALTAFAFDCDTDDVAKCVRSIVKLPPVRQVVPSVPRRSAVLKGECGSDNADDIKTCLRGLKAPGGGRLSEPDARPAAAPAEGKPPEKKSEAVPTSATVASKPTQPPGFAGREERLSGAKNTSRPSGGWWTCPVASSSVPIGLQRMPGSA